MNILIENLVVSAFLLLLLMLRPFHNRWMNIILYCILSVIISYYISHFFNRYFGFYQSKFIYLSNFIFVFISYFVYLNNYSKSKPKKSEDTFLLQTHNETLKFYYPRDNFLVYGGAGSGKTASLGKPLLEQFIINKWAGFIYDYKDFDYTKTAYNLIKKCNYPFNFYYVSFTDMSKTYRFNILRKEVIGTESLLFQVMDDFLGSMLPSNAKKDEWYNGALGLLKGVAIRFYNFKGEYAKYCTLPHILNFILLADSQQLITFLEGDLMAKRVAGAFIGARSSERTADSYVSSLNNYISVLATNKNVCFVLSGNDFIFNLTDPQDPKLFAISNNFALESLISPIVAMLVPISARKIEFGNKVKFAFILDEMTTFKVNNFQNMPSVLREYNAAFLIMTQSGYKLEKVYGKHDRASIESNCANFFIGRTKDPEALKYYSIFFGKEEQEKISYSSGSSTGGQSNSNVTRSKQKEEVYDSKAFVELGQGEFILSAGECNVKYLKDKYKMFKLDEDPLPIVRLTTDFEVDENYQQISIDCQNIIQDICGG